MSRPISFAPQRLAEGDTVVAGEKTDYQAGQRDAAGPDAGRHDLPQCRNEAGQGRSDRPFGRHLCARSSVVTRAIGDRPPQFGRTALPARRLHGHGWCGVEPRQRQPELCQGGPAPVGRAVRPLTRGVAKNPVDHPHGGGEGRTSGGRPSGDPVGQADQGCPHAAITSRRTR